MKITKKSIKANEEVAVVVTDPVVETATLEEVSTIDCPYQKAIDCIYQAIECLGAVAKEDALARESIANLSVVFFDLKC